MQHVVLMRVHYSNIFVEKYNDENRINKRMCLRLTLRNIFAEKLSKLIKIQFLIIFILDFYFTQL